MPTMNIIEAVRDAVGTVRVAVGATEAVGVPRDADGLPGREIVVNLFERVALGLFELGNGGSAVRGGLTGGRVARGDRTARSWASRLGVAVQPLEKGTRT